MSRNLVALWETLGSGSSIEASVDNQEMRQNLWGSMKVAFISDVLPNIAFMRRFDLEEAARDAALTPEARAEAEYNLVSDYVMQLNQVPHGYGATPILSKELGYKLNCVSKSAIVAALCEENGTNAKAGDVSGHQVVVIEDSAGGLIYGDSNGIVGRLKPEKQTPLAENVIEYEISNQDRKDLQIPFKLLLVSSPEMGFVRSIFGNLNPQVMEEYRDTDAHALREKYAALLDGEDWEQVEHWLVPELDVIEGSRWKEENRRVKSERSFGRSVLEQTFSGQLPNADDMRSFLGRILSESGSLAVRDRILPFLEGISENATLPGELSPDIKKYWTVFRDESQKIRLEQPDFYDRLMNRVTLLLHSSLSGG